MDELLVKKAGMSFERLLPRIKVYFTGICPDNIDTLWMEFEQRLTEHWESLFTNYYLLYSDLYDFFYHLEEIICLLAKSFVSRPDHLKAQDKKRENNPHWYHSQEMIGGALYVTLFCENLRKLKQHIPYFKKLGLTYIHLMPLFAVRAGDNDGGYAISNYRAVNPDIGTLEELVEFADLLRKEGISLVLDFVLNHTADDHQWAVEALKGNEPYRDYYYLFDNRSMPDEYEKNLRSIFPTIRKGNFTWNQEMRKWIWTTFNSYQWDLNYSNPEVFQAMAEEMFFIINNGVEVLRMDAVPFIWKKLGTNCENREEAHFILRAYNAMARIAAPSVLFKSEAIVAPDDVIKYIDSRECQLSYNPTIMALLWEALATRHVNLLSLSIEKRVNLPEECMWINYLRCHDDIGWTFDDNDARSVGINPSDHRRFLNQFYTGQFKGSFARGIPFQHNPVTGDTRIAGTLASLAGLEQALQLDDKTYIDMAVKRIMLLRAMLLSLGGMPLIYLGEEWGMLNDYQYIMDPAREGDSRWIHRPKMKWEFLEEWNNTESINYQLYHQLLHLIQLRKKTAAFQGSRTICAYNSNPHVLSFIRRINGHQIVVLANFADLEQQLNENELRLMGNGTSYRDIITDRKLGTHQPVQMGPYEYLWLENN